MKECVICGNEISEDDIKNGYSGYCFLGITCHLCKNHLEDDGHENSSTD